MHYAVPKHVLLWMQQDLVSELENERTNRVIAQQTANQERLQARASAAESASLRRQLNELNQHLEQEKRATAAARLQGQQTDSSQVSTATLVTSLLCWPALHSLHSPHHAFHALQSMQQVALPIKCDLLSTVLCNADDCAECMHACM